MKEKDISWIHFQEVMAAIQNFLEEEASREPLSWNAPFAGYMPGNVRLSDKDNQQPLALPLVQYYLSQHRAPLNTEALRSLPVDLFVRC